MSGSVAFWLPDNRIDHQDPDFDDRIACAASPLISLQQNSRAFTASAPQTWHEAVAAA
jgi:hypothetical protein